MKKGANSPTSLAYCARRKNQLKIAYQRFYSTEVRKKLINQLGLE